MNDSGVHLLGRLRGHYTAVLRRGRARVPPTSGLNAVLDAVDGGLAHSLFRAPKQSAGRTRTSNQSGAAPARITRPASATRPSSWRWIVASPRGTMRHLAQAAGLQTVALRPFGPVTSERR